MQRRSGNEAHQNIHDSHFCRWQGSEQRNEPSPEAQNAHELQIAIHIVFRLEQQVAIRVDEEVRPTESEEDVVELMPVVLDQ